MTERTMTTEDQQHLEMITTAAGKYGLALGPVEVDEDDRRIKVAFGRWFVPADDEERGLFADDEGSLSASVVGAEQYGNLQVKFYFAADGTDAGIEVEPYDEVEPL